MDGRCRSRPEGRSHPRAVARIRCASRRGITRDNRGAITHAAVHEYSLAANRAYKETAAEARSFSELFDEALEELLWL